MSTSSFSQRITMKRPGYSGINHYRAACMRRYRHDWTDTIMSKTVDSGYREQSRGGKDFELRDN